MAHTLAERVGASGFLNGKRAYYGAYTACFVVLALVCFGPLVASGHSIIWEDDGLDQHFTFFCYFGSWVREAVSTGTLPLWDFSLGYGADIICSLASWIGDPFNWFSVLCPERYSEFLYQFLTVVRLYLVGFAFSSFCRYHKRDGFATLLGALAFAFCGYCLMKGAFRHAMFINPAFLLPWVLLGADKVLDGKRPTTLIVALAVTFVSYFYFAYMIVIFLVLYCLLRYFAGGKGGAGVRGFFALIGRFVLYGITAALMAGALLTPIVAYVLQMDRISAEHGYPLLRGVITYLRFPLAYIGGSTAERGLSMEALVVFGASMLFLASCCKHGAGAHGDVPPETLAAMRQTRIVLAVFVVFAVIPFFGRVFNGFSYTTDRWMFALAMASSYALTLAVPLIPHLQKRDWRAIGIVFGLFAVEALVVLLVQYNKAWPAVAIGCLALTYIVIYRAWKRDDVRTTRAALAALLFVNVAQFATMGLYTQEEAGEENALADYMAPLGQVLSTETDNAAVRMIEGLGDKGQPYRFDKAAELFRRNSTVMQRGGFYSVDFYASIYSQVVDDFRAALAIPQNTGMTSHLIYTSNSRAPIEAITSVKYFVKTEASNVVKPFGFDTLAATETSGDTTYELWQTDNALSFAFTYDKAIAPDAFEAADPLRRQEALLQGCAVEGSSLPETDLNDTAVEVPFTVNEEESDGAYLLEDGSIACVKTNGKLVLEFEGIPQADTYLYFDDMDLTMSLPDDLSEALYSSLGPVERIERRLVELGTDTPDFRIRVKNGKQSTVIRAATTYGKYYTGRHTWLVNTGYTEKPCTKLVLTLEEIGTITLGDMKVLCQPMGDFAEQVAARAADETSVKLGTNTITGSVDAPGARLLYLSVPYSQGWSATVDGEPAEVLKANSGFMAIEVGAGQHEFALAYETPFLKAGVALSIAGLVLLALIVAFNRKRRPA